MHICIYIYIYSLEIRPTIRVRVLSAPAFVQDPLGLPNGTPFTLQH